MRLRVGNFGDCGITLDLLNAENIHAIEFVAKLEREVLAPVRGESDLLIGFLRRGFKHRCGHRILLRNKIVLWIKFLVSSVERLLTMV